MVANDKTFRKEGVKNRQTLEDSAMELAELVLRVYKRELDKKGETKDGQ